MLPACEVVLATGQFHALVAELAAGFVDRVHIRMEAAEDNHRFVRPDVFQSVLEQLLLSEIYALELAIVGFDPAARDLLQAQQLDHRVCYGDGAALYFGDEASSRSR